MKLYILRDTLAYTYANIIYAENDASATHQAHDFLAQRKVLNPTLNPKDFKLFYVCTICPSSEDIPNVTDTKSRPVDLDFSIVDGFYNAWLEKESMIYDRNISAVDMLDKLKRKQTNKNDK